MPTPIRGMRHTGLASLPDVKAREIESNIVMVRPDRAPFVSIHMAMGGEATPAVKYEWGEDDVVRPRVQINGTLLIAAVEIEFKNANESKTLQVGMQLWEPNTDQVFRVDALDHVLNKAAVTFVTSDTGIQKAVTVNDEYLVMASEAQEEGVTFSDAISYDPSLYFNYTEEFETAIEFSWRHQGTKEYTEHDWKRQIRKAAALHKEKMERAFLFGARTRYTGPNGKIVTTTGGVVRWINSVASPNITNVGGVLTKRTLSEWLAEILKYGDPNRKVLYVTPTTRLIVTELGEGFVRVPRSEKTLGMEITKVQVNGRMINLVENYQLSDCGLDDWILCIDMAQTKLKYLAGVNGKNFKTKWYQNVQARNFKGQQDVMHGDEGIRIKNPLAHGILKGITG